MSRMRVLRLAASRVLATDSVELKDFRKTRRKPELSTNRAQSSDLTVNLALIPQLVSLRTHN